MPYSSPSTTRQSGAIPSPIKIPAIICVVLICVVSMASIFKYSADANRQEGQGTSHQSAAAARSASQATPDYEKIADLISQSQQDLTSTIAIPIAIDLSYLEQKLNDDLSTRLADINETKVCVKAKWLKTKVPYLDGLKLKSRQLKTKVSPEIRCNINGYIDRRDKLTVTGQDNSLLFSLPVHASVTAKAGISETAVADATFFANASIDISENWQPQAVVDTDFKWDRPPELKLFDLITITFGSKVEPTLRKKLKALEKKIPHLLSKVDFKTDVESAWHKIQQPIRISDQPPIYSHFEPSFIGYSGFEVSDTQLTTQLIVKGHSRITTTNVLPNGLKMLPPLERHNGSTGTFRLVVPAIIEASQIQSFLDTELKYPVEIPLNEPGIEGMLTIRDLAIHLSGDREISVTASVNFDNRKAWLRQLDLFDWFSFNGSVELDVKPVLDSENSSIRARDVLLNADTSSLVADSLADALRLPFVKGKLASLISYDFSTDIEKGISAANEAMHSNSDNDLSVTGQLDTVAVKQLVIVDGAVAVVTVAKGKLQATLGR